MRRAVVALLLVTGCSLPLPDGVRSVDGVEGQSPSGELLRVIPPGPRAGQQPREVVQGFLQAQASADDGHAVARSFLTPAQAATWDDTAGVLVYALPAPPQLRAVPGEEADRATVSVTAAVTGEIAADGAYTPRRETVTDTYRLQQVAGEWRLAQVPPGLRLTAPDRDRSYRAQTVYHQALDGAGARPHLVPDRVFLPATGDLAERLVRRVLLPPTDALGDSVAAAVGLQAEDVSVDSAGVVTVDLAAGAEELTSAQRQGLSAQLVWTLRGLGPAFTGLRLRADGRQLTIPGEDDVQDDGDWDPWDPEGLPAEPPLYYVADRRLRAVGPTALPESAATRGAATDRDSVPVDQVVATPDSGQVALLEGTRRVTVRTGQLQGPFRVAVAAAGLTSPSYGSGSRGLWLVRGGRDLVLLPPGATSLVTVPVVGRPAGRLTAMAASRDGARLALVVGDRLYVGRLTDGGGLRVVGLRPLSLGTPVTDVAWVSGTELALVGAPNGQPQLLRIAVDGSALVELPALPVALTAAPTGPVVGTKEGLLLSVTGRSAVRVARGTAPSYPG